ncbi:hypothetical protein HHI36_016247 [Cryptolaemus montrouzieri]|uniref:BZIP domain-containing protein n=1 Tax=Cryptolaemus montrouzieri TaxID=559131 RepID=A0ABD2NJ37_9CUCU
MLQHDTTEMDSKIYLLVNPYEVNPGSWQHQLIDANMKAQITPVSEKENTVNLSTGQFQEVVSEKVKVEMEEFSDLGDLITTLRGGSVMDEFTLSTVEPEEIDFTIGSNDSLDLENFIDSHDSSKLGTKQVFIDKPIHTNYRQINLSDIIEDESYILQQKQNVGSIKGNLNNPTKRTNLGDMAPSNVYNFEYTRIGNNTSDHQFKNITSHATLGNVPMEFQSTLVCEQNDKLRFKEKFSELSLGVKLFMEDSLNTPEILESVVSLEDERFDFLNHLGDKKLKTVNETDLQFQPLLSPQTTTQYSVSSPPSSPEEEKRSRKRNKYDDDEDYVPPTKIRQRKKTVKVIETDTDSEDEEYATNKIETPRSRRLSSVSSDSFGGASKYRELRDKNNEASRKSRLKRKIKEQEMEMESQELRDRNVKLKAEVEELQKMVDNLRSNLFHIMLKNESFKLVYIYFNLKTWFLSPNVYFYQMIF